ncbi:mediator of RNA polymerase II transcription subunit 5 [Scheffersomyces amazonensis]|uniref:mediator of RNA polymerase II transcription subunit 5 n=1 Tax=Scheffersomyces amazonensis TaxID=1078765 RepID=UPI00315CB658
MTSDISLKKLVRKARSKKLISKIFLSLYEELNARQLISDNEYTTEFLQIDINDESNNDKEYQIKLAIDVSFSSVDQLTKFWTNLSKVSPNLQVSYIIQVHKLLSRKQSKIDKEILKSLTFTQLKQYISSINFDSKSLDEGANSLINQLTLFTISFIKNDKLDSIIDDSSIKALVSAVVRLLKLSKLTQLLTFFISKIKSIVSIDQINELESQTNSDSKSIENDSSTSSTTTNSSASTSSAFKNLNISSLPPAKLENFNDTRKFLWFSKIMKDWKFDNNEKFLKSFINNFVPNQKRKNPYYITSELIKSSFKGFGSSVLNNEPKYILFNWKNFIVSRIPIILLELKISSNVTNNNNNSNNNNNNNNSEEIDTIDRAVLVGFNSQSDSIIKVLTNLKIGSVKTYDLRQLFVKSLIFNKLLPPSAFQKFFPMESKITHQVIMNELNQFNYELNIKQKFREKLININGEFTSLEESGLISYCDSLPTLLELSYKRQTELSLVVLDIMKDLIQSKQHEKLNRLLLSILNNIQLLNIIAFNSTPEKLLFLLIDFIDSEYYDVANDDDENFQESYSYCGVIILATILIIETFKIDLSCISFKNSFLIEYINDFYYRLCDNLTNQAPLAVKDNEEDSIIIINYNNLLTDWVNALFDDSNDGLSDELIKSIGIKQIYKLIPIVYQQAIVATEFGKIDFKILTNGLDYLSQIFLIPCIISIIQWLLKKIRISKQDNDSLFIKVLFEIIKSNNNSTSHDLSTLIFKTIINISGSNILLTLKKVKDWDNSTKIKEIINTVTGILDPNYIEMDSSLKESTKTQNLNLTEEVKNHLINFQSNFESSTGTPPYDQQTFFYHKYLNNHAPELVRLLILETQAFQKSNNELTKVFINLAVYMIVINSVESNTDKQYWKNQLSNTSYESNKSRIKSNWKTFDQKFNLSMESHYSSIFNDSNSDSQSANGTELNQKKEESVDVMDGFSSMLKDVDDDDMILGDDDDLFNDKNIGGIDSLPLTVTSSEVKTSIIYEEFKNKINQNNNLLRQFNEIRLHEPESTLGKTLNILNDKIIEEINALYF